METEANWNILPAEIHKIIIGYLDVPARLQLAKVSHREADLVHTFGKQNVDLQVEFDVREEGNPPVVELAVIDKFYAVPISIEVINTEGRTQTNVFFYNKLFKTKTQEGNQSLQVISNFVKWALREKTFNVQYFENILKNIGEPLCLRPDLMYLPQIIPEHCDHVKSTMRMVSNFNILHTAALWLTKSDFTTVVNSLNMIYNEIEEHSIFDECKLHWIHLSVLIDFTGTRIDSFERALQLVRSLGLEFIGIQHVVTRDEAIRKLESPKAIESIMYFIRAYHRGGNDLVTYLDNDPNAQEKITFLREGLNFKVFSLADTFQLTLLIVVFRLRLILSEPGVPRVYERICESFKLVMKYYPNYYERIMAKIETLVKDI